MWVGLSSKRWVSSLSPSTLLLHNIITMWPGTFLDIIGQNLSVSKSNWLHAVIIFVDLEEYIPHIPINDRSFSWSLEFWTVISQTQPVHYITLPRFRDTCWRCSYETLEDFILQPSPFISQFLVRLTSSSQAAGYGHTCELFKCFSLCTHFHNIIQIHNSVMCDWQYFTKCSSHAN